MANVTLWGASYSSVPALEVPATGGGKATFHDVSDTTAVAADVATGKYFHAADGTLTEGTSSGGGGVTVEALSVTSNGTYTAPAGTAYSPVTVNVSGGGSVWQDEDGYVHLSDTSDESDMVALIEGTLEHYSNSEITSVRSYAFYECRQLKTINLPNATTFGSDVFRGTLNLRSFNFPSATTSVGGFYGSKRLVRALLPSLTNLNSGFRLCDSLATADLGENCTSISSQQAFAETPNLTEFILRRTDGVVTIVNTNVLETNHMSILTMKTGYVYVPRNLISSYQNATNWSSYYAINPNMFRALEDYTVDGTTSGAIDYSKIWSPHTPVYTLEDEEFSTDHVVDTGVQLFNTNNPEFTIVFSVTGIDGAPSGGALFSCMDSNNIGFKWTKNGNSTNNSYIQFYPTSESSGLLGSAHNCRDVLGYARVSGLNAIFRAYNSNGDIVSTASANGAILARRTGTIQTTSETLLVGGAKVNGTITPQWKGTVHWLKVYNECLNYNEIVDLLGLEEPT